LYFSHYNIGLEKCATQIEAVLSQGDTSPTSMVTGTDLHQYFKIGTMVFKKTVGF
jgi:hypothetical protein